METIFKVKGNKVSCVVFSNKKSGSVGYVGRAKCNPTDDFNEEFGRNLAYKRALLKLKKAETAAHRNSIKCMQWIEPEIRRYQRHQNGLKFGSQSVERLKQEIATMLSNE